MTPRDPVAAQLSVAGPMCASVGGFMTVCGCMTVGVWTVCCVVGGSSARHAECADRTARRTVFRRQGAPGAAARPEREPAVDTCLTDRDYCFIVDRISKLCSLCATGDGEVLCCVAKNHVQVTEVWVRQPLTGVSVLSGPVSVCSGPT